MNRKFIAIVLGCGALGSVWAQNDGFPTTPGPRLGVPGQTQPSAPAPAKEQRFDVSFKGGRPQQLVKALDEVRSEATPVIIPANAPDVTLPPFELRNVTLLELFNALNLLGMNENWAWQMSPRSANGQGIWVLMTTKPSPNGYQNLPPSMVEIPVGPRSTPPEMKVQPIYVGYLLEKLKIEDLTTAIETGWQMSRKAGANQGEAPELKYHKDTELLLIKGYPAQISFVNELLQQLGNPQEHAKWLRDKSTTVEPKEKTK